MKKIFVGSSTSAKNSCYQLSEKKAQVPVYVLQLPLVGLPPRPFNSDFIGLPTALSKRTDGPGKLSVHRLGGH